MKTSVQHMVFFGLAILAFVVQGALDGLGEPSRVAVTIANSALHEQSRFLTLSPGAKLPSGDVCARRVRREGWEPRPQNSIPNHTMGTSIRRIDGADGETNARFAPRVDGAFTGTTDEIIQWAACKWGFDEDIVRATAVQESWWRQSTRGDFNGGVAESFGLLQVRATVHEGTYPTSVRSTAFNVDYALAWRRACFEGGFGWLNQVQPGAGYEAGDEWGCVGAWYSGRWWNDEAYQYVMEVQGHLRAQTWRSPDFSPFSAPRRSLDWGPAT